MMRTFRSSHHALRALARPTVAHARLLRTSTPALSAAAPSGRITHVQALEQMDALPWYRSALFRIVGMFTEKQYQAAAGTDLHTLCIQQSADEAFFCEGKADVDSSRFFPRFQVKGLHVWLVHVRLRDMPHEQRMRMSHEILERFWEIEALQNIVLEEELELLQALKYQKELQLAWHGLATGLDTALKAETPRDALAEVYGLTHARTRARTHTHHTRTCLYVFTYISNMYITLRLLRVGWCGRVAHLGLYKIFFHAYVCAGINDLFITPAYSHYPHYCNTSVRLLCHIPPPDPLFVCLTPYNIGDDNIV